MGFSRWYDQHVVPVLICKGCGLDHVMALRGEVVPLARGDVFELGCGGGLNQTLYRPEDVASFAGIDPSPALLQRSREAAAVKGWRADLRHGFGEDIPFADASFDTVVTTFTLCSVADQQATIRELRRVLRPQGRILFLEHGGAPDHQVAKWQARIEPVWKRLAGGCHLTRPVSDAFRSAGLHVTTLGQRYLEKSPRFAGWVEWGCASFAPQS